MEAERRKHLRAGLRWPVTIKTTQGIIRAETRNIGAGGAYIHCDNALEPGEFVPIAIKPPNRSDFKVTALVVWAAKVMPLGMGVRFVEISEEDSQFICNAVSDHLKLDCRVA
jgi:hypothetical protein